MPDTQDPEPFVSTGRLPAASRITALVDDAYEAFRANRDGDVSGVYPALSCVPPNLFGISIVTTGAEVYALGDAAVEFTIMSIAKPFVFALVADAIGAEKLRDRVGVNATGRPFNSVAAVEAGPGGRTNPMVNAGAIATTSLTPGASLDDKWRFIQDGLSRFAGRPLALNDEVYASAMATNQRNQAIAQLLDSYGRLAMLPGAATELYTRQCSLNVSATDLAFMGATLAGGGVNPLSRQRVVDPLVCHHTLAVMLTAGLYETSGDWLYDTGLPGKSGIGGGFVHGRSNGAGLALVSEPRC